MKEMGASLIAGWQAEIAAATRTQEQIHAGLAEVHAGLEELKKGAYQDVEKGLSVFEDEFFADLRQRAEQALDRVQGFDGELTARMAASDEAMQGLRDRISSLEAELNDRVSRAFQEGETLNAEVFGRLAEKFNADAAALEKTAGGVRAQMKEIAAGLLAGWQAEVSAAAGARDQVNASLAEVRGGLEEVKARAGEEVKKGLSALEAQLFAELRTRTAQALKNVEGFEGELSTRIASSDESVQALRDRMSAFRS